MRKSSFIVFGALIAALTTPASARQPPPSPRLLSVTEIRPRVLEVLTDNAAHVTVDGARHTVRRRRVRVRVPAGPACVIVGVGSRDQTEQPEYAHCFAGAPRPPVTFDVQPRRIEAGYSFGLVIDGIAPEASGPVRAPGPAAVLELRAVGGGGRSNLRIDNAIVEAWIGLGRAVLDGSTAIEVVAPSLPAGVYQLVLSSTAHGELATGPTIEIQRPPTITLDAEQVTPGSPVEARADRPLAPGTRVFVGIREAVVLRRGIDTITFEAPAVSGAVCLDTPDGWGRGPLLYVGDIPAGYSLEVQHGVERPDVQAMTHLAGPLYRLDGHFDAVAHPALHVGATHFRVLYPTPTALVVESLTPTRRPLSGRVALAIGRASREDVVAVDVR